MLIAIARSNVLPWRTGRHGAATGFSGTMPIATLSDRHAPIL
ncbi:MAG: hypothetical protein WC804_01505 [Sphingomonas sp.]